MKCEKVHPLLPFRILFLARGFGTKIERVMRQVLLLVFLETMALPSWTERRMSVAKLEQTLNADWAAHKPDAEIARQIRNVDLNERITDSTFDRLGRHFAAGSQPALALRLLADRSSFLDPPASELPTTPAPDAATQQQLLDAAQRFALQTLPRLPNFLATRTTLSFDDSPQEATKGGYLQRMGLHRHVEVRSFCAQRGESIDRPDAGTVADARRTRDMGRIWPRAPDYYDRLVPWQDHVEPLGTNFFGPGCSLSLSSA